MVLVNNRCCESDDDANENYICVILMAAHGSEAIGVRLQPKRVRDLDFDNQMIQHSMARTNLNKSKWLVTNTYY